MKMCLILSIIFSSALCWTSDEKQEIITTFINEIDEYMTDNLQFNIFSKALQNPYFGDRFSNFRKVLGAGAEGVVLEVDFQLLPDHPQTIPAALKINYSNLGSNNEKILENYLNLMVKPEDQSRNEQGNDLVVFNLSQHYEKMLEKDPSFKDDVPFVSMIYEAAIISFEDKEDDSGITEFVSVTVTQLGFSELPGTFLPIPGDSSEIMKKNSVDVARMIIQMCYGLWRIHYNGFIHKDIHSENIIVAGNPENFYPMFIDFDSIKNQDDFLSSAFPLKMESLNPSDPNYSEYLEYSTQSEYLIEDYLIGRYFKLIKEIPYNALSSELQKKLSASTKFIIIDPKYNVDFVDFIKNLKYLIDTCIKRELIDINHENINQLGRTIYSIIIEYNRYKKYLTSRELFEKLNEASGLNLNEFHFVNEHLESYFEEIRSSRKSGVPNTTTELHEENNERNILV
jgi:serine/threonine protein kinase